MSIKNKPVEVRLYDILPLRDDKAEAIQNIFAEALSHGIDLSGAMRGHEYALEVQSGKRDECTYVRQAVCRYFRDIEEGRFQLDFFAANKAIAFIETLKHIKGPLRGECFILEGWQCFFYLNVYGFITKDGYRRYKRAYLEVARGNGKSAIASGTGLLALGADGEGGAEVYSAATTKDQARIVFDTAMKMVRQDFGLQEQYGLLPRAHDIQHPESDSIFKPLSADGSTNDGLNIHLAVVDELHAHKTRELYDVLLTGAGKRKQPLLLLITTAGTILDGICYEERTYVTKILERTASDDNVFGVIYTLDKWDDWKDKTVWHKANPNWGISVMPDAIETAFNKALAIPSSMPNFCTKHLNIWMNADHAYMNMEKWDANEFGVTLDDMEKTTCPLWLGIDLAAKVDLAAKAYVFSIDSDARESLKLPDKVKFLAFNKFYLPESAVMEQRHDQYQGWADEGYLTITSGEMTDFSMIEEDILWDAQRFNLQEVAYDPYQATQLAQNLMAAGIEVIEFRNTVANMSEPMKEIDALTRDGRLGHEHNPCMRWNVSNVVAHTDAKDNIFPRKEQAKNKIDGFVALIFAIARAIFADAGASSIYEDDDWY